MTKPRSKLTQDCPATYQIEVQGYLEAHWSDWFDGMDIVTRVGAEGARVSRLTGTVVDQAALQGMLRKLYDLGLPLLSVNCIEWKERDKEGV